ncbi:MAG TPA: hypothetical protein VNV25_09030 [Gemmatimonadaceae bacterium]|jgi:beta-glucosidase-like glycosyl hydrolase|nr:hypothetical protein [Gemmatimonadaceae bacterium]
MIFVCLALAFVQLSPRDRVHAALDSLGGEARARSIDSVRIEGAGYATGDNLTTFAFAETRDDRHPRLVQDVTVIVAPGVSHHSVRTLTDSPDWFTEAPENVLLAALDAPDLTSQDQTTVRFTWHGKTVRVQLAPNLAVELDGATTVYSHWRDHYPRQWTVSRGGTVVESFTADRVSIW